VEDTLAKTIAEHPYPLIFVTLSGAHLYGFPSPDSDYDLRGVHVLDASEVLGLDRGPETIERMSRGEPEIDLVTHDAEKFFRLLLRPNGYVLEQLYSPLVLVSTPSHEELQEIARGCITRWHARHYVGFAENQWRLFTKEHPSRVKPLLYTFRVLLTGIHLMRTGAVEANLTHLVHHYPLPFIEALIERKRSGERATVGDEELCVYEPTYLRLLEELEAAAQTTHLPDRTSARPALHDLLLRIRSA
jgi:predicted nucleotidyltransferase